MPFKPNRTTLHPKTAAAGVTAGGVGLAAGIALLLGAQPEDPLVQWIAAVVIALIPVVAAYLQPGGAKGVIVDNAAVVRKAQKRARRRHP